MWTSRCAAFCLLLVVSLFGQWLHGQSGQASVQYLYDSNGRLIAVIAPDGEAATYTYDAVGNITSVQRIAANAFVLLAFSPQRGSVNDQVVFNGVGLDSVTSVSFNGTAAQILSASSGSLVAQVPTGATTGAVSLSGSRGTLTSAAPFTVVGRVQVTPSLVFVPPGTPVRFQATVIGMSNQQVNWGVNGVAGGNNTVGTIDATGFYQPPNINIGLTANVTATSQADATMVGQATVIVNPGASQVRSPGITVTVGLPAPNATMINSRPVSVGSAAAHAQAGLTSPGVAVAVGASRPSSLNNVGSAPVSVTLGPAGPASLNRVGSGPVSVAIGTSSHAMSSAVSRPVSVAIGTSSHALGSATSPPVAVALGVSHSLGHAGSAPVSVVIGALLRALSSAVSGPVSATTGPVISAISPAALTRGATATVTVTGSNLGAAASVSFAPTSGAKETNITISNIVVSSDGTTLIFTASVGSSATAGSDVVAVTTPNGNSVPISIGINVVQVQ